MPIDAISILSVFPDSILKLFLFSHLIVYTFMYVFNSLKATLAVDKKKKLMTIGSFNSWANLTAKHAVVLSSVTVDLQTRKCCK